MHYTTVKFKGYSEDGEAILEKVKIPVPLRICDASLGDQEFDS